MLRTLIGLLLVIILLSGTVFAEDSGIEENNEVVAPDSELYDTTRLIEENEYELTESNSEKALIQSDNADKRITEVENMLEEGNPEIIEELMEDYNKKLNTIEENLQIAAEKQEQGIADIEKLVMEKSAERNKNLTSLLGREDLPQQAKAGITRALENQQRAMQHLAEAMRKREEALQRAEQARENAQKKAEEARGNAIDNSQKGQGKAADNRSNNNQEENKEINDRENEDNPAENSNKP